MNDHAQYCIDKVVSKNHIPIPENATTPQQRKTSSETLMNKITKVFCFSIRPIRVTFPALS